MIDISLVSYVALSLLAGCILGIFYFGGLWLTVRSLAYSNRPALRLAGSFLLRTALLLPAFYVVMDGRFERLIFCLIGFYIARKFLASARQRMPRERGGA